MTSAEQSNIATSRSELATAKEVNDRLYPLVKSVTVPTLKNYFAELKADPEASTFPMSPAEERNVVNELRIYDEFAKRGWVVSDSTEATKNYYQDPAISDGLLGSLSKNVKLMLEDAPEGIDATIPLAPTREYKPEEVSAAVEQLAQLPAFESLQTIQAA